MKMASRTYGPASRLVHPHLARSAQLARGFHLRSRGGHHNHNHNHEVVHDPSFLRSFTRDPFFRPLMEELRLRPVGRPCTGPGKEGPRLLELETEANVLETNHGYAIEAEMPGLRREDIKVAVKDGNQLVIQGEKRFESKQSTVSNTTTTTTTNNNKATEGGEGGKERPNRYLAFERSYGTFTRTFVLPESVDPSKVTAKYVDGVLTVDVPKVAQELPKAWDIAVQ